MTDPITKNDSTRDSKVELEDHAMNRSAAFASAPSSTPRAEHGRQDDREVLRCLVNCADHLVREFPRGARANLENARHEIRKAREALDGSPTSGEGSMASKHEESEAAGPDREAGSYSGGREI